MSSIARESKRVCYIRSVPEWYGHRVNDIFFRQARWLFVPLDDLTTEEKIREYQKSMYFFISGYGRQHIAQEAHDYGCTLVGPRCDVDPKLEVIEIKRWDNMEAYQALIVADILKFKFLRKTPLLKFATKSIRLFLYTEYVLKTIVETY